MHDTEGDHGQQLAAARGLASSPTDSQAACMAGEADVDTVWVHCALVGPPARVKNVSMCARKRLLLKQIIFVDSKGGGSACVAAVVLVRGIVIFSRVEA